MIYISNLHGSTYYTTRSALTHEAALKEAIAVGRIKEPGLFIVAKPSESYQVLNCGTFRVEREEIPPPPPPLKIIKAHRIHAD